MPVASRSFDFRHVSVRGLIPAFAVCSLHVRHQEERPALVALVAFQHRTFWTPGSAFRPAPCGLDPAEMVSSSIVFKALRNFRAGVEACISFLKRSFGMGRCTWSGPTSFKAYVWSAVVAANALLLARHRLAST